MDIQKLDERIMELIDSDKFEDAERELHERKSDLSGAGADRLVLDHVLSLLVTVNLNKEPRDLAKAESYCLEREQTIGSGYAKLQYAMTLYWSMDDPERTVAKAREAIAKGREESDDKTVYQSLGLLGLALLDLHRAIEADANYTAAYLLRGDLQRAARRPEDAVKDYGRAIALE